MPLTAKSNRLAAWATAALTVVTGQAALGQVHPTKSVPPQALVEPADFTLAERRVPVPDEMLGALRAELDRLARGVSVLLADAETRADLLKAMEATDAREDILHLHTWLATQPEGQAKEQAGPEPVELRAMTEDAEDRLADLGVGERPYLDLYIPAPELRAAWEGGPLLVAANPLRPEDEVDTLTAYRIGGERLEISATEAPDLPLLVIAPDEHATHRPPQIDISELGVAKESPDEADTEGAQVLGYHGGSGSIGVPYMRIADDNETKWWKGAPEIRIILETEPVHSGGRFAIATEDLIVTRGEEIDTNSGFFAHQLFNEDGNLTFDELIRVGDHDYARYSNNAASCAGFLLPPFNGDRTCLYVPEQRIGFIVIEDDPHRWDVLIATEINPGALPLWGYTEERTADIEIDTDVDPRHP